MMEGMHFVNPRGTRECDCSYYTAGRCGMVFLLAQVPQLSTYNPGVDSS